MQFLHTSKLDQYLYDSELVIRADHKPLKNAVESTIETRRFSTRPSISGLQCKSEYIEGMKTVCAIFLSCLPHNCSGHNSDDRGELSGPDITSKTFEINLIYSSIIPKDCVQYDQQMQDKHCLTEDITLPGYNLIEDQSQNKEFVKIKKTLKNGKAS